MTKKNIHQRLAEVMQKVTYIQKERKQGMNYTIVSHDVVTAKVRPALLDAGIVYYPVRCDHTHNGNRAECGMTIRFVNIDEPSDFFDVQTFGYGVDPQDKGPGKAMSYAVKYALLKALGLETGDDADHDSIDHDKEDPADPPKQPEPKSEPERDPRKIADSLIKNLRACQDSDHVDAAIGSAKFDAAWRWLEEVKPAMSNEVKGVLNEVRDKFDGRGQAA